MRSLVLGLIVFVGVSLTILSIRPGGLRRQLRLAGRRFRIVLVLGGVWVFGSLIIHVAFRTGPVADYGPSVVAIVLGVVFMFVGRDPVTPSVSPTSPRR
jgi:hypothetical protein